MHVILGNMLLPAKSSFSPRQVEVLHTEGRKYNRGPQPPRTKYCHVLRPYSQVEHFQSRHVAASPVHLRCRILSPGLLSDKKETAKSRVCHPLDPLLKLFFTD